MATETATIRVSRETRDLLAEQARQRGESLSSLLAGVARRETREQAFLSEREATVADRSRLEIAREEEGWESALTDGIE